MIHTFRAYFVSSEILEIGLVYQVAVFIVGFRLFIIYSGYGLPLFYTIVINTFNMLRTANYASSRFLFSISQQKRLAVPEIVVK